MVAAALKLGSAEGEREVHVRWSNRSPSTSEVFLRRWLKDRVSDGVTIWEAEEVDIDDKGFCR